MPGGGRASRANLDSENVGPFDLDLAQLQDRPNRSSPAGIKAKEAVETSALAEGFFSACDVVKEAFTGDSGEIHIQSDWLKSRQVIGRILSSNIFICAIAMVISINTLIILVEADRRAQCVDSNSPDCSANFADVRIPDLICGLIYIFELLMRVYVWQSRFCCSFWNVADTVVVIVTISGELFENSIQNAALIRLVRIFRIVRILRVITMFQELYLMIASLASTMRTIFWACILLVIVISIMALLAVEMLHPLLMQMMEQGEVCDRCPTAFSSISNSMVTFFATIIMGDGIFDVFVPLIEADIVAALIILTCVALVYLGFSNLVLSVIVDRANEARCQDPMYQALAARSKREKAQTELLTLWREVDTDGSNTVTLEELREMHATSVNFRKYFKSHNIDMELLTYAFSVMDPDGDGHCDFKEFAETLVRLKSTDPGPATAFMKHQMGKVVAELIEIKDLLNKTEQTPIVEAQERCNNATDKFTLESKVESKATQGIAASLDENLRGVADVVANAIPAMDTMNNIVRELSSPIEAIVRELTGEPRNFDFAAPTPAGSGYGGSGSMSPGAPQANPMTTAKWQFIPGASAKHVRSQSPSEAAEELVELLKYAYEKTRPLGMQHLRGLEWHYADLCQRVEVQLGRLLVIVQDSEARARMELFCCSARLISSLGAAMPRILPDPSSAFLHLPGANGSDSEGPDLPEVPQKVVVHNVSQFEV